MKCPPKGSLLYSIIAQKFTWKLAFGEWIDNALDAGASSVNIVIDGNHFLSVRDDGEGCSDPRVMVIPGDRIGGKKGMGRYGIGGKDSGLWVGDMDSTYNIKTIHAGSVLTLEVNWRHYAESDWDLDDPSRTVPEPGERGTRITVSPVRRKFPEGSALAQLLSDLGYLYSPALKRGIQITFQTGLRKSPVLLKRWELPRLRQGETVDTQITVKGKTARVFCGILEDDQDNPRMGITYLYRYRVIIPSSPNGCGRFNPSRICGFVDLGDSWGLTKNKDGILDEDALFESVEEACRPVLVRAEEIGRLVSSVSFETRLNQRLQAALKEGTKHNEKARRQRTGETQGTIKPVGTSRKHRRAKRTQPGDTFGEIEQQGDSIRISYVPLDNVDTLGKVMAPHIMLNTKNDAIADYLKKQNEDATLGIAMFLLTLQMSMMPESSAQMKLKFAVGTTPEDIAMTVGKLLAQQTVKVEA